MKNKKLVTVTLEDCNCCPLSIVCGAFLLFQENITLKKMVWDGDCQRSWSDLVYIERRSQKKPALNPTL